MDDDIKRKATQAVFRFGNSVIGILAKLSGRAIPVEAAQPVKRSNPLTIPSAPMDPALTRIDMVEWLDRWPVFEPAIIDWALPTILEEGLTGTATRTLRGMGAAATEDIRVACGLNKREIAGAYLAFLTNDWRSAGADPKGLLAALVSSAVRGYHQRRQLEQATRTGRALPWVLFQAPPNGCDHCDRWDGQIFPVDQLAYPARSKCPKLTCGLHIRQITERERAQRQGQ